MWPASGVRATGFSSSSGWGTPRFSESWCGPTPACAWWSRCSTFRDGARAEDGMGSSRELTALGVPVPELPVVDVERAQEHYRDALGFDIGWIYPGKEIGSVSRGHTAVFLRKRVRPF